MRRRPRPSRSKRRPARRLQLESLETRELFDSEGLAWSAPNLTISFVPDGTEVAGASSALYQRLDPLGANSAVWQDAILRGFEVWTG
ncbi:MAG: hypothetical protein KDB14_31430, partial [Planctomycetales bacterium]|nr:hypothetical protein [Planctomycetales bacterium]